MTSTITSSAASSGGTASTTPASGSADTVLREKLARCNYQLGDWEACPSGKTPEGKKIIQDLQNQIHTIETQINATSQNTAKSTSGSNANNGGASLSTLGGYLNTYA